MDRITLRTSERSAFKRCPQKWWWAYVECLGPSTTATPLWFGSIIHEALALWYGPYGRGIKKGLARGPHPADTVRELIMNDRMVRTYKSDNPEDQEVEKVKAKDLAFDMMTNYVETYGNDSHWKILLIEHKFQLRLPAKGKNGVEVTYVGTFDGVALDMETGEIWLLEHKTTAVQTDAYLALDDQGSAYFSFAKHELIRLGLMTEKQVFAGVMYNYMRKAVRDTRPKDANGFFTNKPQKAHYIAAFEAAGVERLYKDVYPPDGLPLAKLKLEDLEFSAGHHGLVVVGERSLQQGSNSPLLARVPLYKTRAEVTRGLQHIRDEARHMAGMKRQLPAYPVYKVPTKDCEWCPFFMLCSLDESGDKMEVDNFKRNVLVKVDPYQVYADLREEE